MSGGRGSAPGRCYASATVLLGVNKRWSGGKNSWAQPGLASEENGRELDKIESWITRVECVTGAL